MSHVPIFHIPSHVTWAVAVVLDEPSGTIRSGPYANDALCSWQIRRSVVGDVVVSFESMNLEQGYDFVKVYQSCSNTRDTFTKCPTPLLQLTGTNVGAPVTSAGSDLLIELHADNSQPAAGFVAHWNATAPATRSPMPLPPLAAAGGLATSAPIDTMLEQERGIVAERCSGVVELTTTAGTISDGGDSYTANMRCEWLIRSGGEQVTVRFDSVSLEAGYDFIKVYSGETESTPLIGMISEETVVRCERGIIRGSVVGGGIVCGNSLLVVFTSDASVNALGFSATYSVGSEALQSAAPTLVPTFIDRGSLADATLPPTFDATAPPLSQDAIALSTACYTVAELTSLSGRFGTRPDRWEPGRGWPAPPKACSRQVAWVGSAGTTMTHTACGGCSRMRSAVCGSWSRTST